MKIIKFEKATLDLVRNELNEALSKITAKYGLSAAEIGRISYDDMTMTTKLSITAGGNAGKKVAEQKNETAAFYLKMAGLQLGQKFKAQGKILEIVGYNSRNHKNAIELKDEKGRGFKGSIDMVKRSVQLFGVK